MPAWDLLERLLTGAQQNVLAATAERILEAGEGQMRRSTASGFFLIQHTPFPAMPRIWPSESEPWLCS
jgi:hypothetical protein